MFYYAHEKLRLPARSTQEQLEGRFCTVIKYGDKVLLSGYYYMGPGVPSYYGVVYQFLEGQAVDDDVEFVTVSDFFPDDGHAIEWAIKEAQK